VLPAAKASPSYDYPQAILEIEAPERSAQAPSVENSPAMRSSGPAVNLGVLKDNNRPVGLSDLKAQLRQATGKSQAKPRETEKPAVQDIESIAPVADVGAETATEFSFKIRYFHINEQLAVIDELPYAQGDEGAGVKIDLLKAILSALKVNWNDSDFRTESFSWPIDSPMEIEGDTKLAAQQILKGFIAQRHGARKFDNLLVFAGQIEAILAEPVKTEIGTEKGEVSQDFIQMPQNYHMTLTSTLSAMLSYPLLKRQVWAHLQPLKKRLAADV
jgi:hypothetical protein